MFVLCHPHVSRCDTTTRIKPSEKSFQAALDSGLAERKSGHTALAIKYFLNAGALAPTPEQHARALLFASGSQIRSFQYRAALQSSDAALTLALQAGNNGLAGAASNNRSTVYSQLGDRQLASDAAKEAVRLLEHSGRSDHLARAILNYADTQAELGKFGEAVKAFQTSIQIARRSNLGDEEAFAEDHLGLTLVENKDFPGAANAYAEALRLRISQRDRDDVAVVKQHMAELANQQGDYRKALILLTEAETSGGTTFATTPQYWPEQLRGEILLALHRRPEALATFRHAARLADAWRRDALPGDVTSIQTTATLHSVYRDFVDLAAETSLEHHDPALAREALSVLASNRAATLREQMVASLDRQMRLPPRYFELLSQLQSAEASLVLGANPKQSQSLTEQLQRTRNELADLENTTGIGTQINSSASSEKNLVKNSLIGIQRSLSADQLLLSFSLGKKKSFLWGVSNIRLELYELPSEDVISTHASAYFLALQKGNALCEGAFLYKDLLRQLTPALAAKKEWLIAADGVLLDHVPFASLPASADSTSPQRLVALHSFRFLPSEQFLLDRKLDRKVVSTMGQKAVPSKFIGVADPIYNYADSRLPHNAHLNGVSRNQTAVTLARLAGTAGEVRSAAKIVAMTDTELLTGTNATLSNLQAALAAPPSVLHFAVHVVNPSDGIGASGGKSAAPGDAALALSLTSSGVPELLTKEAIARLHVPGALIVLSGCASQAGEIVPSAGLIGLGRAWLLAGAAAVIVSAWPTPDSSGEFFSDFYSRFHAQNVRAATLAERASSALQQTQVDMQRSASYRSSPSFWAAYSMISEE